jgi:hypothetical protein
MRYIKSLFSLFWKKNFLTLSSFHGIRRWLNAQVLDFV